MSDRHPITRKTCEWCREQFFGGPKARYCTTSCGGFARRRAKGVPAKVGWRDGLDVLAPYREKGMIYQAAVRAWLADYKIAKGCADCGYAEHAAALQLDHEGEKSIEIAAARTSVARLLREIERGQCVVRCANCHSIKTWERKQK